MLHKAKERKPIMKTRIRKLLVCASLVGAATLAQAQFEYTNNGDGTCTITNYTGSGGAVIIPDTINSLKVTGIGIGAFSRNSVITSVIVPDSVMFIRGSAFLFCPNLTSVTIGNGVTFIIKGAFGYCTSLTSAYFQGNAPNDTEEFIGDTNIVYYLPGTTNWGSTFGGRPTELWNPQAQAPSVTGGQFGFNITGPSNTVIVVEACTDLANSVWLPVSTNALNDSGASMFSDSQSGSYPARFYRFRSP